MNKSGIAPTYATLLRKFAPVVIAGLVMWSALGPLAWLLLR